MEDKSFTSHDAFEQVDLAKFYGPAGDGYEYHHIVEQSAEDDIAASDLNSTHNIVRTPKLPHEEISSESGQTEHGARESLRAKMHPGPIVIFFHALELERRQGGRRAGRTVSTIRRVA
jgi:hypothetical protein